MNTDSDKTTDYSEEEKRLERRLQENHELCSTIWGLQKQLSAVMKQAKELYEQNAELKHELALCRETKDLALDYLCVAWTKGMLPQAPGSKLHRAVALHRMDKQRYE